MDPLRLACAQDDFERVRDLLTSGTVSPMNVLIEYSRACDEENLALKQELEPYLPDAGGASDAGSATTATTAKYISAVYEGDYKRAKKYAPPFIVSSNLLVRACIRHSSSKLLRLVLRHGGQVDSETYIECAHQPHLFECLVKERGLPQVEKMRLRNMVNKREVVFEEKVFRALL